MEINVWEVYLKYDCGKYFQGRAVFSNLEKAIVFCDSFDFTPFPYYQDMELDIYQWELDNLNSGVLVYTVLAANVKKSVK